MTAGQNNKNKTADPGTRQRIIEAAAAEFAECGLAGARVDRIAETAGVNKAMIYYHFGSKKKLYEKTIVEHIGTIVSSLKLGFKEGETLEERLKMIASTYTRFMASNPMMRRIFIRELADPDGEMIGLIANIIRDSEIPKQFATLVKEGQKNGRLKKIDHHQAMATFISMNIGFYLLLPVFKRVLGLKEGKQMNLDHEKAVVDIFLSGVTI